MGNTMTVDELKDVLDEQFQRHEKHEDLQHAEIIRHFDRVNGSIAEHAREIKKLEIRDALWVGGLIVGWAIIQTLFK
jgi:hypothetical protein